MARQRFNFEDPVPTYVAPLPPYVPQQRQSNQAVSNNPNMSRIGDYSGFGVLPPITPLPNQLQDVQTQRQTTQNIEDQIPESQSIPFEQSFFSNQNASRVINSGVIMSPTSNTFSQRRQERPPLENIPFEQSFFSMQYRSYGQNQSDGFIFPGGFQNVRTVQSAQTPFGSLRNQF